MLLPFHRKLFTILCSFLLLRHKIAQQVTSSGSFDAPDVESARKGGKTNKKVKKSKAFKDRKEREAFYLFDYGDGQGFTIISADQRMTPVLAYSDSNSFDLDTYQDNPGVMIWLESLTDHITRLRDDASYRNSYLGSTTDRKNSVNGRTAHGWSSTTNSITTNLIDDPCERPGSDCGGGGSTPMPIQTWQARTHRFWGQGCGYNDLSPRIVRSDDCDRAPAGCGPVAVAQVLHYHRNRFGSMTYNGVPINFNNMPPSNPPPRRFGQSPDIARLMGFIGSWIIIDYGATYGLALPSKIPAFLNSLGFSSSLSDLNHTTVANEIKAGRPVILKAKTPSFIISFNQHIWVCEGYRYNPNNGAKYYYMNWGWYGDHNDWYLIDDWTPGDNEYTKGRHMITVR